MAELKVHTAAMGSAALPQWYSAGLVCVGLLETLSILNARWLHCYAINPVTWATTRRWVMLPLMGNLHAVPPFLL